MQMHRRTRRWFTWPWFPSWRYFLRFFGVIGAAWEIFIAHTDRPDILILIGGMLGIPELLTRSSEEKDERSSRTTDREDNRGQRQSRRPRHKS